MNSNAKGEIAVLKARLRALEKGMIWSVAPEGCRYDAVLDDGKLLQRVQVKYADGLVGAVYSGSVSVKLSRNTRGAKWTFKPYKPDEVDLLLVYLPKLDKVCAFRPDQFVGKDRFSIRVAPSKNNQAKGCLMADDHLF